MHDYRQQVAHLVLNDMIASSLAFTMLDVAKLDGFRTGCILLIGLLFYDIWWVFGTSVVGVHMNNCVGFPDLR
jgi:hypothetical protein